MRIKALKTAGGIAALSVVVLFSSCSSEQPNANTPATSESPATAESSPQSSPKTGFESDLQYVKNGQYQYIWVFSRKDGQPLNSLDSIFLRANAPQVVDWVITDGGKKAIAGTNFNLEEGNLGVLKKRFNAEDYTGK